MAMKTSIMDFLIKYAKEGHVSFHMPGHKGSEIYKRLGYGEFLEKIMDCDVTEIPGADNLFQAEGIIKEAQERYAMLYDVKKSYILINGTSGGILASILAAVPKGKKIVMARNCHKSVFNSLTLGDIEPIYAYPEIIEGYGILGQISPAEIERLLADNPDAEAVILPSPNYYGICSDIKAIAEVTHKAGKVLIVDQAHGAHLKFFGRHLDGNMPKPAEECGADLVINSIHKTLASFTQSAVLNLNSGRVDQYVLEDKLQAIQSTSPSYILMASLDINASILEEHGLELIKQWHENLDYLYNEVKAIENLKIMENIPGLDRTKINIDMSSYGISGSELERQLMTRGICSELVTGNILMCMSGIGNTHDHMERLAAALKEIAEDSKLCVKDIMDSGVQRKGYTKNSIFSRNSKLHPIPRESEWVSLMEAENRICAYSIIPYPPGIPLICPGEKITSEAIEYVKELRNNGEKVIGVNEKGEISVGKINRV